MKIENSELIDYFSTFISEKRNCTFKNVISERTKNITVVLEDLYQAHNASAVLRSCDCFGIQDVHIIENANKFKVNDDISLGSSKWLNIYNYRNFENNSLQCINQLKENGYKIVATTPHNHHCMIDDLPADSKIALVFGTELTGISDCIRESADVLVKIPMFGFTESFNISVSVAICIHTLVMKMRKESSNWRLTSEQQEEILLSWYRKSIISSDLIEKEYLKIKSQSK